MAFVLDLLSRTARGLVHGMCVAQARLRTVPTTPTGVGDGD
jgi:hypothetical protein